jgi:hypothetical protein
MADYNPRLGQYGSGGGFSYDKLADYTRRAREAVSKFSASGYQPGAATPNPFDFMGKAGNAAAPAFGIATVADILHDYKPPWERNRSYPAADAMADHNNQPMPPVQGLDLPPPQVPMPQARPPEAGMAGPVPMPQARPAEAPQDDTGFFMRNALMMQDPAGGGFIDPEGAASVRGPDLISKMMGYLHNKV